MQYFQLERAEGLVASGDGELFDLGTADPPIETFRDLAAATRTNGTGLADLGRLENSVTVV
ncbi:hypothetical protein [Natrinema sp. SYSU A 869]|uniref:hypothetical protein n=1 Tax=Natrinema sp. SYSU A 869 TaxID=2871694 RepID=UPI001CA411B4|nr:hypothetical protein [Natrinema sp. SYSU A 869]